MFTGLVEGVATLTNRVLAGGAGKLQLKPQVKFANLEYGESIAVNGACLTLEKELPDGTLEFHTLEETLSRTNLGAIPLGGTVNLERALRLGDRLGGHIVTGHVDSVAAFVGQKQIGSDIEYRVALPKELKPFFVSKGSIAIDGVSLTMVDVASDTFSVHLIPVTLAETALGKRKPGDLINLETDSLGKYVQQQLKFLQPEQRAITNIDMNKLFSSGW